MFWKKGYSLVFKTTLANTWRVESQICFQTCDTVHNWSIHNFRNKMYPTLKGRVLAATLKIGSIYPGNRHWNAF